jgi:DNA-binding response OmpR family regulator
MTHALVGDGHDVEVAEDTLSGLKMIYEIFPDLVIMSREVSNENEQNPIIRIRQLSYLPTIAVGSREETAETLELGADAFIQRPIDIRELLARVNSFLRRNPIYGYQPGDSERSRIKFPQREQLI